MPVKNLAFETLRVTVDDQVLTVTLDDTGNPLNLFTWQRMEELGELMSRLRDETAVRAVVLTGSGRYFSGGRQLRPLRDPGHLRIGRADAPAQPQALQGHARGRAADRLRRERPGHRRRVLAGAAQRFRRYIGEIFEQTHAVGFALEMLDFRSRDHHEAIAAFKEGRPPVFTGS